MAKRILCIILIFIVLAANQVFAAGAPPLAGVQLTGLSGQLGKPRIVVAKCTVEDGGLVSNSVCEVRITLRNTSTYWTLSSILVTGSWSDNSPPPVDFEESNQVYVSRINPTQTRDVVFRIKTQDVNITALGSVPMYLHIAYSYEEAPDNSNSVLVRIPVKEAQVEEPAQEDMEDMHIDKPPSGDQSMMRLIYAGSSGLCAVAAVALIVIKLRRR